MPPRGGRHQYQSRFGDVRRRPRLDEPRVLVAGVVDHQVHDQPHAARVQLGDQLVELRQRAEQRVDVLVVADVVAVVGLRRGVDRREPQDVDAEVGQVVQPLQDAAEVTDAVAVGVLERARIDLVDDGAGPPGRRSAGVHQAGKRVVHGLDVVAVGIAEEDAVVARVVLGPDPRLVQDLRPRRPGRGEDLVDGLAGRRGERQVHRPVARALHRPEPQLREAVRAAQARRRRPPGASMRMASRTPQAANTRV